MTAIETQQSPAAPAAPMNDPKFIYLEPDNGQPRQWCEDDVFTNDDFNSGIKGKPTKYMRADIAKELMESLKLARPYLDGIQIAKDKLDKIDAAIAKAEGVSNDSN